MRRDGGRCARCRRGSDRILSRRVIIAEGWSRCAAAVGNSDDERWQSGNEIRRRAERHA